MGVDREKVLARIREQNRERMESDDVGGVREWFDIHFLLCYIDTLERKLDES